MIKMQRLPLAGIRIVDTSYVFAGPYAAGLLCDLGAEIIKIEGPSRPDLTRGGQATVFPDDEREDDPEDQAAHGRYRTLPGLRIPEGSHACLIRWCSPTETSSSSRPSATFFSAPTRVSNWLSSVRAGAPRITSST